MKQFLVVLVMVCCGTTEIFGQTENSIFWEVKGNGLEKPSYLFGTFHLLKGNYVDSFAVIKQKLFECKAVVGELNISDTTGITEFMLATKLTGTSIAQLYDSVEYKQMNDSMMKWVKLSLKSFPTSKPMYIQTMIMQMAFPKVFPEITKSKSPLMDIYFQQLAKQKSMQVLGLETIGEQSSMLFGLIPLERQVKMLKDMLLNPDKEEEIRMLMKVYERAELYKLDSLMNKDMNSAEVAMLVDNRNKAWIPKLETQMKQQPIFVAVGAAHLAGKNGIVELLRAKGYSVVPIALH